MDLSVEVVSDIICPWCYIGKRRLEKAAAELGPRHNVRVIWRAFELNPDMPEEGMARKAYRTAKFGSWERAKELEDHVAKIGREVGLEFAFDRIRKTPSTFNAHRLLWLARREGVQDAVAEALFRGYFQEGEDIGATDTLTRLAAGAGLDAKRVARLFAGDEGGREVRIEEADAQAANIRGVPAFRINGRGLVSGAQPVPVLVAALEEAAAHSESL